MAMRVAGLGPAQEKNKRLSDDAFNDLAYFRKTKYARGGTAGSYRSLMECERVVKEKLYSSQELAMLKTGILEDAFSKEWDSYAQCVEAKHRTPHAKRAVTPPRKPPSLAPVVFPALGGSMALGGSLSTVLVALGVAAPWALLPILAPVVVVPWALASSVPWKERAEYHRALRAEKSRLALESVSSPVGEKDSQGRLSSATARIGRLREAGEGLDGEDGRQAVAGLVAAASELVAYLGSRPERVPASRKFLDYYPEAAEELVASLREMETNGITCEDEDRARERTLLALRELAQAFDTHRVAMNDFRVMGITATTEAVRSSLRNDGYLPESDPGVRPVAEGPSLPAEATTGKKRAERVVEARIVKGEATLGDAFDASTGMTLADLLNDDCDCGCSDPF